MDNNFWKQVLTCSIFNVILVSCAQGKENNCYRKVRQGDEYVSEFYCCVNYEMRNGTCKACEKGYASQDGGNCIPCTGNVYGYNCLLSCNCTNYQICHHIFGCIRAHSTRIETTFKDITIFPSFITTSITERGQRESTETNHGMVPYNQNIVMYTICIGSLLVVITLCYIFANRLKNQKNKHKNTCNKQPNKIQHVSNLTLPIQKDTSSVERIYDEIEEVSIHVDIAVPNRHANVSNELSSDGTSTDNHESMKSDDYLNPYQPIVNDSEKHEYNTVSESFKTLDRMGYESIASKCKEEIHNENTTGTMDFRDYLKVIHHLPDISLNGSESRCATHCHRSQMCLKTQRADKIHIPNTANQETSQSNLSKLGNTKNGEESEVPFQVSVKRLTI